MSFLIAASELHTITGYARAKDQAAWIREHYGIPAHVNAANECVVVRCHLENAGAGQQATRAVRNVRKAA